MHIFLQIQTCKEVETIWKVVLLCVVKQRDLLSTHFWECYHVSRALSHAMKNWFPETSTEMKKAYLKEWENRHHFSTTRLAKCILDCIRMVAVYPTWFMNDRAEQLTNVNSVQFPPCFCSVWCSSSSVIASITIKKIATLFPVPPPKMFSKLSISWPIFCLIWIWVLLFLEEKTKLSR